MVSESKPPEHRGAGAALAGPGGASRRRGARRTWPRELRLHNMAAESPSGRKSAELLTFPVVLDGLLLLDLQSKLREKKGSSVSSASGGSAWGSKVTADQFSGSSGMSGIIVVIWLARFSTLFSLVT
ncbi:hypothetical protein EYF80_044368 [Liparis tanakae]|uniref:Uncharacterized protein n=1 Tax=Liparis tanakae TaxID=230148 RepID=A0A4Z2FYJ6_9TELE|nr:hypothetical protein EYF80_044368 [Liparis tanakae]